MINNSNKTYLKGHKSCLEGSKNHVDNILEIKIWYIIIDNVVKEQHLNLQSKFICYVNDFVFRKTRNEVNKV
jgi:hypothetical protein